MKERIRLGIVGCGVIGRFHADAAANDPGIHLVAVADLDGAKARELATAFDVPHVYRSGAKLVTDDKIDAVVLALVTGMRARTANAALRAGKHVLLEKPPAMNAGQIRRYMKQQGGLVVGCCSSRLSFLDGARVARDVVVRGELGAIRIVRCRGLSAVAPVNPDRSPPPWRVSHALNGGGFLVNWGVYDLDYLMYVTGWQLEPETVLAQTWPIARELAEGRVHPDSDAENHAVLFIRCRNGEVITLERGEAVTMQSDTAWQITGESASLRLRMTGPYDDPVVVKDEVDFVNGLRSIPVLEEPGDNVQHQMPVRDFCAAIREARQPRTDLPKALVIQKVLDAAYASARSGRAVRIKPEPVS